MVVVKDPVCGMVFVKEDAAGQTVFQCKTYYFCAPSCKKSFDLDAKKYLANFDDIYDSIENNEINLGKNKKNEKDNSVRQHD